MSNEGPPACNTRSATRGAHRGQPCGVRGMPRPVPRHEETPVRSEGTIAPCEGTTTPPIEETAALEGSIAPHDNDTVTHKESATPIEESVLTSIADTSGIEQASTGRGSPAGHALSKHETIHEYTERSAEEQSYNTASAIAGPSAGPTIYSTPYSKVPLDKGKRRATSTSCRSNETSLS
jgi:hypothetical protein